MTLEKEKEKVKQKEKEKEKTIKEKEKVQHTRQMAVNHSLPPNQGRIRMPLKVNINNNITIKIGPKTGGGQTVMLPRINHTGAKTVAGLHGSPSPTQSVFWPGWNPGTPLTCTKTLFT